MFGERSNDERKSEKNNGVRREEGVIFCRPLLVHRVPPPLRDVDPHQQNL